MIRMDVQSKRRLYEQVLSRIEVVIEGETDLVAVMATMVCELHHAFEYFDWTGFYRVVSDGLLKVGPYQGGHGCLTIEFERGVCGAAARTGQTQLVPDVHERPDHIACSSSTRSEVVVPVRNGDGRVIAVLDIDSDQVGAFDETDCEYLERLCEMMRCI